MAHYGRRLTLILVLAVGALGLSACSSSSAGPATTRAAVTTTTVAPTTTTTTSVAQVGALVNTLFYNVSQAFQNTAAAGWAAELANDYPGAVNAASFQSCTRSGPGNSTYTLDQTPDLATLSPDPAWVNTGPTASEPYWVAQSSPPAGTTYLLQVQETYSSQGQQPTTTTSAYHVTVLHGTAYFYQGPAC